MKEWIEIIVGIAGILSLLGTTVLAWLWAVKYRIPNFEKRLAAVEGVGNGGRSLVYKHEIYSADGRPFYMHRSDCDLLRAECGGERSDVLSTIKEELAALREQLSAMEANRTKARIETIAFMTAVKEKLNLKYIVPES